MVITENINIFKLVRTPFIYDFIKYFKNFKINLEQSTQTKLNINDYFNERTDVSQSIVIHMVFNIKIKKIDLEKEANLLLQLLKINEMDREIFKIL